MSLISDALRKAHTEAAQQDRALHQFYMSHGGRSGTAGHGLTRGTVILAALVGACVTAAAALFYMTRIAPAASPVTTAAVVVPAAPAPAATVVVAPPVAPVRDTTASSKKTTRTEAVTPAVTTPEREAPPPQAKPAVREDTPVREEVPARVEAPRQRASRDHFVHGETYLSPIVGPLGAELSLSGISSARGASVAIINGNLVRAGAAVGPFVIEEIEQRRVRVRYVDVIFWLTY